MSTRAPSPTPSTSGRGRATPSSTQELIVTAKEVKVPLPPTFDGTRGQLKTWLLQVELYMSFQPGKFNTDKQRVLWTVTLLKGAALNWIEVYVDDHMQNQNNAKQETKDIILNWAEFREQLETMFGDIDAEHTAERQLHALRQKGPASGYAAAFRQFATRTKWNDESLRYQFYRGLKDSVKDEMARGERPEDLEKMIETAITIDNRMYERQLEKKNGGGFQAFGGFRQKQSKPAPKPYYGPMPMELDAVNRREQVSKTEMDRRRQNKLCFKCGQAGHQSKWHYQKGKPQAPPRKPQRVAATGRRGYCKDRKEVATMQVAGVKRKDPSPSPSDSSDSVKFFDTTELDEQLKQLLAEGYNGSPKAKARVDLKVATFIDKYEQCDDMREYRQRYGEPTDVLENTMIGGTRKEIPKLTLTTDLEEVPKSRVSRFIENLGSDSEEEDESADKGSEELEDDYALTASEERQLAELAKNESQRYQTWKNERLDATQLDHPCHPGLLYTKCARDECEHHREAKEKGNHFPKFVSPVYMTRVTHRICALTTVKEKEDSETDEEEESDEESEGEKKLREAWEDVHKLAAKTKIEVTGQRNGKLTRAIRIEIPDSDDESDEEARLSELDQEEQALWKEIQRMEKELLRYKEVHRRVQRKIARHGGDVAEPSHPRHPELCHRFCGHDGCQTHFYGKTKDAYFHGKKEPIYLVKIVRDPSLENIEAIRGPEWNEVLDEQRRLYALNY